MEVVKPQRVPAIPPDLSALKQAPSVPSRSDSANYSMTTSTSAPSGYSSMLMSKAPEPIAESPVHALNESQTHTNAASMITSSYPSYPQGRPPSIPDRLDRHTSSAYSAQQPMPMEASSSQPSQFHSSSSSHNFQSSSSTRNSYGEALPPSLPHNSIPSSSSFPVTNRVTHNPSSSSNIPPSSSDQYGFNQHAHPVGLPTAHFNPSGTKSSSHFDLHGGMMNQRRDTNTNNSYMMDSTPHSQHQQQQQPASSGFSTDQGQMSMMDSRGPRGRERTRRSQGAQPTAQGRSASANVGASSSSAYTFQQAMSDHFEHYKRPPSRDSSLDRYGGGSGARARSRQRGVTPDHLHSRPASRQRTPFMENPYDGGMSGSNQALDASGMSGGMPDEIHRARGETPSRFSMSGREHSPPMDMAGAGGFVRGMTPQEDVVLRHRGGLGQEIPPVPYTPKRTESMFLKPAAMTAAAAMSSTPMQPSAAVKVR